MMNACCGVPTDDGLNRNDMKISTTHPSDLKGSQGHGIKAQHSVSYVRPWNQKIGVGNVKVALAFFGHNVGRVIIIIVGPTAAFFPAAECNVSPGPILCGPR